MIIFKFWGFWGFWVKLIDFETKLGKLNLGCILYMSMLKRCSLVNENFGCVLYTRRYCTSLFSSSVYSRCSGVFFLCVCGGGGGGGLWWCDETTHNNGRKGSPASESAVLSSLRRAQNNRRTGLNNLACVCFVHHWPSSSLSTVDLSVIQCSASYVRLEGPDSKTGDRAGYWDTWTRKRTTTTTTTTRK